MSDVRLATTEDRPQVVATAVVAYHERLGWEVTAVVTSHAPSIWILQNV